MSLNFHKKDKIFLSGHNGLVGSAIYEILKKNGYNNIITASKKKLDLRNQQKVQKFFLNNKIDAVIIAAAKVGGINDNNLNKIDYLYDNTMIAFNLIHTAFKNNIKRLIFLGSSCIYPRNCKKPIKEEYLLTSSLEPTNDAYAIAKIAAIKLCHYYNQNKKTSYRCLMPTNIYGLNDNFDPNFGHVIPSLITKFENSKSNNSEVIIWDDGIPKREFLHVNDLAEAVKFTMEISHRQFMSNSYNSYFNVGSNEEISIKLLVNLLEKLFNHNFKIKYDSSMPNGTLRKKLNSNRLNKLGWKSKIKLKKGLADLIQSLNN